MRLSFELDVEARCAKCGAECDVPDKKAARVLRTEEALYVDVSDRCSCGASTVRVMFSVD